MPETKKGRGRPEHVPTPDNRKTVQLLITAGNGKELIAKVLKIHVDTLEKHYADELETGLAVANANVAANLYAQATKDDPKAVTAAIFWLKSRAGWNEYGPTPAPMIAQKERVEKLGKKAEADELAKNPDASTPMGALMAKRQATLQ
jgi:hypothetical protein